LDRELVAQAIATLDREVPREGARVKFRQYGGGPDEGQVIANEAGYFCLGVEFLKAGLAPTRPGDGPYAVEADIDYLVTDDSDINFDMFERRDLPELSTGEQVSKVVPILVIAGFAAVLTLAGIGLISLVRWLAV
jgi:hypothetical protein